jgi:hypothetical protein
MAAPPAYVAVVWQPSKSLEARNSTGSNHLAVQSRAANFARNLATAFTHYLSERLEMSSQ